MISRALHLSIFEQPVWIDFFNNLLEHFFVVTTGPHQKRTCAHMGYTILKNAPGSG
jgi:hypothetical protein